jgi:hypothetical protein
VPGDDRLARRRLQQRGEHAQRRGLAGAVRAEKPDQLTFGDVDVHAANRVHRTGLGGEPARETACLDHA